MSEIKVKAQFSLSELMSEFEKTQKEQEREALTAKEIRELMGWSEHKVNKFLNSLLRENKLGVIIITTINRAGWPSVKPAYFVKDNGKSESRTKVSSSL